MLCAPPWSTPDAAGAMINAALEMERGYRPVAAVLDDPTLARVLLQNQRQRYRRKYWTAQPACCRTKLWRGAASGCRRSGAAVEECAKIADPIPRRPPDWKFSPVITATCVRKATRAVVYSRGQQLQQEIAERARFFAGQALVLFLLSLALERYSLQPARLSGPVAKHRRAGSIGWGRRVAGRRRIVYTGPRELRSVGKQHHQRSAGALQAWLRCHGGTQFLRHLSRELEPVGGYA